jgi:hypothetical protein
MGWFLGYQDNRAVYDFMQAYELIAPQSSSPSMQATSQAQTFRQEAEWVEKNDPRVY